MVRETASLPLLPESLLAKSLDHGSYPVRRLTCIVDRTERISKGAIMALFRHGNFMRCGRVVHQMCYARHVLILTGSATRCEWSHKLERGFVDGYAHYRGGLMLIVVRPMA